MKKTWYTYNVRYSKKFNELLFSFFSIKLKFSIETNMYYELTFFAIDIYSYKFIY